MVKILSLWKEVSYIFTYLPILNLNSKRTSWSFDLQFSNLYFQRKMLVHVLSRLIMLHFESGPRSALHCTRCFLLISFSGTKLLIIGNKMSRSFLNIWCACKHACSSSYRQLYACSPALTIGCQNKGQCHQPHYSV
jgi:hypothetical protein